MATLYVRRSGRLSNQKKQNQGDDEKEQIDLTTEDWGGAGDGILRAPEIPTHVEEDSQSPGAYQWNFWLNEAQTKMGVDSMANKVAWGKGVGIEVDNIGEDNIDAGKMEDRKGGKQVLRKGKLDQLVKNSKKQAAKEIPRVCRLVSRLFKFDLDGLFGIAVYSKLVVADVVFQKQKPRTQIVRDVNERLVVTIENMEVKRDKEEVDDYVLDVDEDFNVAKRKKRKSYKDVYKNTFKVLARTVKKEKV
ncbi:hypothetical protein Tco_1335634 [Tanacetum coccineum]